ncbi:M13 family metallopeptidase [Ideonella sp. BN130291]|uniref:M13 family metallopeptidase n=1 Tax=Ideonella sp. BN130291 TaxID=3112940 RepID=UPI002E25955D|nr:M13 family metallopeptidase [Ideonella sp. BN130291]
MTLTHIASAALAALALQGIAFAAPPQGQATQVAHPGVGGSLKTGLDRSGFDTAVRPQDDLFKAANGQWLKDTPIPGDKADYGIFIQLRDRADERVRKIVEELAAAKAGSGVERQIGDYYRSFIDEAAIDKAGLEPVKPWFAQVDAVKNKADLAVQFGRLQGVASTPMVLYVGADDKDPSTNRMQTWQGGLGLPDRDYYLKDDERFAKARTAYMTYLETLLRLGGDANAAQSAKDVYALEKRLAEAQWSRVDNRDPQKLYNAMTVAELQKAAPGLDWDAFFKAAALPELDKLILSQPSYATALAKAVDDTPIATWQTYLKVRLLDSNADTLPKAFREVAFDFRGKAIRGLTQDEPRWQKATRSLNAALGEGVGQIYVARHFPPAYKARMEQLVGHLMAAYRQSIDKLSWMSPPTKARAKEKLAKYITKIGYPEVWRDYAALQVKDGDAFGNAARAGRFEHERLAVRAGKPVDRREWGMTPQTVNAYYNPNFNEIVFPAAILEAPFFDMTADDAVNYGAIGAVIGHEISHGFDDTGSQYDGDGKLNNWWTEADRKAFDALGERLVKQYAGYEALPGHKLNGKLTLGENIADLSGLQIAYKAYHLSLKGKKAPVLDGLTGDQRFFLGWSQAWREKAREERALQLLSIDTHSPSEFRANGAAVNHDGFHQSFRTKPGDGMWKPGAERIRIW